MEKQTLLDAAMMGVKEAEGILKGLAGLFVGNSGMRELAASLLSSGVSRSGSRDPHPNLDARYRTLVEQIPAVIFMAFLDRGVSEAYVSPHIEAVLGFSQREWLDDPIRWYRQIHPEDKERWSFEAARMLVTGEPLRSVYRAFARDGRVVWFQCEVKIVRDERGRPWFLHGLAVDITELKETQTQLQEAHAEARERTLELERANVKLSSQIVEREAAEKSLRDSEERFRLLVEGVRDYALFLLDPDGYVVSWNRGAERLKGYAASEIVGKHFSQFYLEEDIQKGAPATSLAIARSAGRYEAEGWRVRKDGSKFWANVLITALIDKTGQFSGFAKLTRDMTEQKLIQERLQETERLAAIGATAAVFAHEVGNPLNGISTFLQFLRLELATIKHEAQLDETLDLVLKEVSRLGALLGDFRSLARPRQLNLSPTDLAQLVAEILIVHAAEYAARGITVEQDFPPDLPMIAADSEKLKQALLNLCKNAMEAMTEGGTLTIRGYQAAGQVSLDIADTGIGIPDDIDIFELFKTTKDYGTGLGLVTVRQIISAHQGTITYRSAPGKGTTFTVSLPV